MKKQEVELGSVVLVKGKGSITVGKIFPYHKARLTKETKKTLGKLNFKGGKALTICGIIEDDPKGIKTFCTPDIDGVLSSGGLKQFSFTDDERPDELYHSSQLE